MKKILIIEDEADLRDEIVDILNYEGYKVIQAGNGYDGLSRAKNEFPDLILCDVMMPEMTGFEVLEQLKKEVSLISVPFIFITALTERHNFRRGMVIGADDYLTKPFTRDELLGTVKTRLEISSKIENKISETFSKMEKNLKEELNRVKNEIKSKTDNMLEISKNNSELHKKLSEKEHELMQEVLRATETKNVLHNLKALIEEELQKDIVSKKETMVLLKLKNRLKGKSILSDNWTIFQLKFNQVYPGFIEMISQKIPGLSQYEHVFISATKMGLNTNHIAELLNISEDSVRKSRYRLKKKLNLKRTESFLTFVLSFGADK